MASVSIVGLGRMGVAMAESFAAAGHTVTGWNRSPKTADEFRFPLAASVAEAVAASELTVVVVLDTAGVVDLLGADDVDLEGRTIVNLTTSDAKDAHVVSELVLGRGGKYLDGIIASYPEGIGRPETALIYGGDAGVWENHEKTLSVLGGRSWHAGEDVGTPAVLDLAVTMGFYHSALGAFYDAALYARSQGIGIHEVARATRDLLLVLAESTETAVHKVESGDFSTDQAPIDMHISASEIARDALQAVGRGSYLDLVLRDLGQVQSKGRGHEAFAAVYDELSTE
ncbi:NAD(P)-binding domain-containing protein [Nocardia sp. NBC_00565]|uniref:NAD(P)-binding domain-containing protein n=1 Tax=Nocardia sp. NBC_00565 TaxID=2975993 RepID=UPI002E802873|nr:NAD(P)-binding domain-containing protein [Nocardia sp. NBC_00565]WUC06340.1 NAD(P)-binding domain-containing protein [Nocardia sp. NBC_00565]